MKESKATMTCNQCIEQMCWVTHQIVCTNPACPNYALVQIPLEMMPAEKPEPEPKAEPVTYSIGDRFKLACDRDKKAWTESEWGEKYMLAYRGEGNVTLVNLSKGEIWCGASFAADSYKITQDEFTDMCHGSKFIRYWDRQKKIYTGDKK